MMAKSRDALWKNIVRSILIEARRENCEEFQDEIDAILGIIDGKAHAACSSANGFTAIDFGPEGGIFLSERQREQIKNTIRILEKRKKKSWSNFREEGMTFEDAVINRLDSFSKEVIDFNQRLATQAFSLGAEVGELQEQVKDLRDWLNNSSKPAMERRRS